MDDDQSSGEAVPTFKGAVHADPQKQLRYPGAMDYTLPHSHRGGKDNLFITPDFQRAVHPERASLFRRVSGSSTGVPSSSEGQDRGSPLSDDNRYDDVIYEHQQPSTPPASESFWQPFGAHAAEEDSGEFFFVLIVEFCVCDEIIIRASNYGISSNVRKVGNTFHFRLIYLFFPFVVYFCWLP